MLLVITVMCINLLQFVKCSVVHAAEVFTINLVGICNLIECYL